METDLNVNSVVSNAVGSDPGNERAQSNLNHYRQMILEEETELQQSRQVIVPNPELKNERVLDGIRASPDFDAYERLCRGELLPRWVRFSNFCSLRCASKTNKKLSCRGHTARRSTSCEIGTTGLGVAQGHWK